MDKKKGSDVEVAVYDYKNSLIPNAKVTLKPLEPGLEKEIFLEFDKQRQVYRAQRVDAGQYVLNVKAEGFEPDRREVRVDPAGLRDVFILGKKGMPFLYRGEVKVPFEPPRDLLGASVKSDLSEKEKEEFYAYARKLKLQPEEVSKKILQEGVLVFRFPLDISEQAKLRIQQNLSKHPLVRMVGPVVRLDKESVSFLTNELVVKFKGHVSKEEVPAIAKRFKLEIVRTIPYAGNAFLLRAATPASYEMLRVCDEIVQSGLVEYAEPNLFSTAVEDQINPTDFLYPQQWHLPLIHAPEAWQALSTSLGPDQTFGSPNVIIAVMDSGVDANNQDFVGNVSGGVPKVYQLFDFVNMVSNNNSLAGDHGTSCAGVTTALANNPSVIPGVNEGVVGAAGNCRLMGLRRSGPETMYSDAYIWAGGFDPKSTTPSFPVKISPGADIITNSFGYSVGMPISGLMKDCFSYLTTYGRGGKGVLLFFSAGNADTDFTLQRPWAAYEKTFAIAASSLGDDGVTEVRATYSNFGGIGIIDICAPSNDAFPTVHNPPQNYAITTTDTVGGGNLPGHPTQQTVLSAAVLAGATSLSVANTVGFSVGQWVLIETPASVNAEPTQITSIPSGTQLNVNPPLLKAHSAGTAVITGPNDYRNNFGGTSSATPLSAGIAALLLSVRPDLTWVEVRAILRNTAVKIDPDSTDTVGRWKDINGKISTDPGYLGPYYSQWYGFGRLDAEAAVQSTVSYPFDRDVIARDNLADVGTVPSGGAFWNSPDIWVRNQSPAIDGAAAMPASYGDIPPHQPPIAGQDNWVYVRLKNVGTSPSFDFYIRVYIAHYPGSEFIYPDNFIPTNRPGTPVPSPMETGTYLIGEFHYSSLAAGAPDIINVLWPKSLIPPEEVVVGGVLVKWHPCLLVEISPQDGPAPTGNHVWDNNNLAQKNIAIVYPDDDGDFAAAAVIGNPANPSRYLELVIDRGNLPPQVQLYLELADKKAMDRLKGFVKGRMPEVMLGCCRLTFLEDARLQVDCPAIQGGGRITFTLPAKAKLEIEGPGIRPDDPRYNFTLGNFKGRDVIILAPRGRTRVPVFADASSLTPIIIGGIVGKESKPGRYEVHLMQINPNGDVSGGFAVELRIADIVK